MLSSEEKRMRERLNNWKTSLASIKLELASVTGELRVTAFGIVADPPDSELHLVGQDCDVLIKLRGCDPEVIDNPTPQYACSIELKNVDGGRCLLFEMKAGGKGLTH
jgi:hypothetical protein